MLRPDGVLALQYPSGTFQNLIPWQPARFRVKEFADVTFEFITKNGAVSGLKETDPSGEHTFVRR